VNQVEFWFAKIERDVIARGVFTSVKELARKLMHDIRRHAPQPSTSEMETFRPQPSHHNLFTGYGPLLAQRSPGSSENSSKKN